MRKENIIKIRIALWIILCPLILMWLWNFVMPKFGIIEINYIEAFALRIITSILFKTNQYLLNDFNEIGK